jgi:hypothetical protein
MGFVVTSGTQVLCTHAAGATATAPVARVKVNGQAVVTLQAPHTVTGCPNVPAPGPCVAVKWSTGANRVKVMHQPLLISDSIGVAEGGPAQILPGQTRVKAT